MSKEKKITFDDLPDEIVTKIIDCCVGDLRNQELWECDKYSWCSAAIVEATRLDWQVKVDRLWRVSRRFQGSLHDILSNRLRSQPCFNQLLDAESEAERHFEAYHELLGDLTCKGDGDMDIGNVVWKAPGLFPPDEPPVDMLPYRAWPVKYGCGDRQCDVQECCLGQWLRALERVDEAKDFKRWQAANWCRRQWPDRRRSRARRLGY